MSAGSMQQLTATGYFSGGSAQDLTASVVWVSSTPAVVTINGAGLATGVAAGMSTITASFLAAMPYGPSPGVPPANPIVTPSGSPVSGSAVLTVSVPAPIASLTPASLLFNSQSLGTASATQSITLANKGNGLLIYDGAQVTGPNQGDFELESTTCLILVPVGGSCALAIQFTPTNPGSRMAYLSIQDSASSSPQTVSLTGTGSGPTATLSATSYGFAAQNLESTSGAQAVATLTNNGNAGLNISSIGSSDSAEFTLAGGTGQCLYTGETLGAGGSCTIYATFAPTAIGTRSGTLTLTDNALGGTQTVSLTGVGSAPYASISSSSVNFATPQTLGTSATQMFTLTNTGNAALTLSGPVLGGSNAGDFQTSTCPASLAVNALCTITVTFQPQAPGPLSATLTFTDNSDYAVGGATQVVNVSGTGSGPVATPTPSPLSFGSQTENEQTSSLITVSNTSPPSNSPLNISNMLIPLSTYSSDFGILPSGNTCTSAVPAGGTCSFYVTFTPSSTSTEGSSVIITDNAYPTTQTVTLTGTGTAAVANLSTTSLGFGSQILSAAGPSQTVTLTNNGNLPLSINSITVTGNNPGDFGEATTCGNSLGEGSKCTITVTFTPSASGSRSAAVTLSDNATSGGAQQIGLTGTGANVEVNWSSAEQTIDGFGGAAVDAAGPLTSSLAQFFFSPSSGIGLSIVRVQVIPDTTTCQTWCNQDYVPYGISDCGCVQSSAATIMTGELGIVQQAQSYGVNTFFASSWSPPGSMKDNGSWFSGGNFTGGAAIDASYASLLESYVDLLNQNHVSLSGISPQNEPDISQTYPSCTWTAQQFDGFVPYLYSALNTAGYGGVKIIIPENSQFSSSYEGYAGTTMNDPAAAPEVGLLAQHGYGGDSNIVAPTNYGYGQHVWLTEDSSQSGSYDGNMTDALGWATIIHQYLSVANVNAFVWWFLSDMPEQGYGTDNSALTDLYGDIPLRAYATGNWSKFVRPGWQRVDLANLGSLLVTAFQSPGSTQSAVVIVNNSSSDVTQVFGVGTQMGSSVVPWITSAAMSLAQQSPAAVTDGSVTYTIPADSVVTFVGSSTTGN